MSRNDPEKTTKSARVFRVGDFTFDQRTKVLHDGAGHEAKLRSQSAEVLAQLLQRPGEVVTKPELFAAVWAGTAVTDDSLVQCIADIRRALGDRDHRLVRTAARKGYSVTAEPLAGQGTTQLPLPDRPSIAVLAFEDYSTGGDRDFLSDAIAEGVITELSRFPELFVIARNSSFSFRGRAAPATTISRTLGVRYLLEGSQQKSGNGLRVTVQLIDGAKGHHLWAETYERDLSDLFRVQDDIVRRVVATVAQKVISSEGRKARDAAGSKLSALRHHLEGRLHLVAFTPEGNEKARQANLAAIAADPSEPYGYVGLAFALVNGHRWGWTDLGREEVLDEARKAARKAVELAPDYYDGHSALARVHLQENDLDGAIVRAERALALNPNDTNAMSDLADFLGYAGRAGEAEALLRKAMRLDPLHPDWMRWTLAWLQWLNGNCEDALRSLNAMSAIPPMANRVAALVHVCLGQEGAAREAVQRLLDHDPAYSLADVRRDYRGKFRRDSDLDRVLDGLRKAGLPE